MNIIFFFLYITFLYWGFSYFDNKYDIVTRFQDKNNKRLRRLINLLSIGSFLFFCISPILEDYFNFLGTYVAFIKNIIFIPFIFRWYIGNRITEIIKVKKEELKNTKIKLTFCYFCGSDLNGENICPNCGKEIEQ
jgi:hypothetical protein